MRVLSCRTVLKQLYSSKLPIMIAKRELTVRTRATDLWKKRNDDKDKCKGPSIVNCADFQIISSGSCETSPSLLVRSEGNSYLFNCNEGVQRACYASKIKLLDLENVFITKHTWKKVSGSLGLALTLQGIGTLKLCIHSSDKINNFFQASGQFMQFFTGMQCLTNSYSNGDYKDSGIHIQPILHPDVNTKFPSLGNDQKTTSEHNSVNKRIKSTRDLIAYACSLPDLPGSLDPDKCRQFNVPIGKDLARLKSGQDVVLADGTIVRSIDVCQAKSLGPFFIIVDCGSEEEIDDLFKNITLNKMRKARSAEDSRQVDMVIHFSPSELTELPRYREWMNGFDKTCKHLILSDTKSSRLLFVDSYRLQYMMNRLDDQIFPLLYHTPEVASKIKEELSQDRQEARMPRDDSDLENMSIKVELADMDSISYLRSYDKISIRPHKFAELKIDNINIEQLYEEAETDLQFDQLLVDLREAQKSLPLQDVHEPELVFLGTGSAMPSKFRNTSGILFNFSSPSDASVILDCGEDTYGQLYRHYGPFDTERILKQLKMIYVSHQHADHHIGLLTLLNERKKVTNDKVILLLPPNIDKLLNYHNQAFQDLSNTYEIFYTTSLINSVTHQGLKLEILKRLEGLLIDLRIVPVLHCTNSCAVTLEFNIEHPKMKTFKVGYSGDARPSEEFIATAQGCDLLIHEATFDHRSQEDARLKYHCTTTEAIEVGKRMKAKFTILTHYTQKYSKIPYFTEDFDDSIGFAFDHLSLKCPSHFPRLPILKPILSVVFKKYFERADWSYQKQIEQKRVFRQLLKE